MNDSQIYDLAVIVIPPTVILVLFAFALWEKYRARRNERQVEAERAMRIGMREANRRGWIPEDYKHRLARFNEDTW